MRRREFITLVSGVTAYKVGSGRTEIAAWVRAGTRAAQNLGAS
jgi:hypothetical protein